MKMTIKIITLLILAVITLPNQLNAQPFKVNISINGVKDTNIYLAHYFGSKILRIDSLKLDHDGNGTFKYKEDRPQGIYVIYLNKDKYFDFLLGNDQQFSIKTSFEPKSEKHIEGADQTKKFQNYQEFLSQQRAKQLQLQKEYESHKHNPDSVKLISEKMTALNHSMENYWETESAQNKGTFFADFLQAMIYPQPESFTPPEGCKNPDSLKWVLNYNYNKDHFWDHFNFSQTALIRTPLIDSKIEAYFKNTLLQIPDSFLQPTINLIEKSKANKEMFQYISLNRLNDGISSEIMGMDKIFVEVAERYFLNESDHLLDSTALSKIREKVRVTKPNLIGNIAPELKLPDSEGLYFSLHQMNAKYTILYFWEPNCNHCQTTTPKLYKELYLPLKDKGVDIYSVCTQNKKEEWMKAIDKYEIHDWTNVWDPMVTSNFHSLYDIYSTPVIYILDSNKHIIAKRLDVDSSLKLLNHLISKN